MKIIEFFGLPFSGKSYLTSKYLKNKKNISSYHLFYYYLFKKKKIPNWIYSYFQNYNPEIKTSSSKKIIHKIIVKIYLNCFLNIEFEKEEVFKKAKLKYAKIFKLINYMNRFNKLSRKKKINYWIKNEIINIYLVKNFFIDDNKNLILSEGLVQRIHSYYLYKKKLEIKYIVKYINSIPISDKIIFVDAELKLIKSRILKHKMTKKNRFYLNNLNLLNNRIKLIYKTLNKYKKIKLIQNNG